MERLCAGPAVPLLYEFFKQQEEYKQAPRPLEESKSPDDITAKEIIMTGTDEEAKDPLCARVVDKFSEILASAVGNAAIQFLPFGGLYIQGRPA